MLSDLCIFEETLSNIVWNVIETVFKTVSFISSQFTFLKLLLPLVHSQLMCFVINVNINLVDEWSIFSLFQLQLILSKHLPSTSTLPILDEPRDRIPSD